MICLSSRVKWSWTWAESSAENGRLETKEATVNNSAESIYRWWRHHHVITSPWGHSQLWADRLPLCNQSETDRFGDTVLQTGYITSNYTKKLWCLLFHKQNDSVSVITSECLCYSGLQESLPKAAFQEVSPLVFISDAQVFFILQQLSPWKQTGNYISFLSYWYVLQLCTAGLYIWCVGSVTTYRHIVCPAQSSEDDQMKTRQIKSFHQVCAGVHTRLWQQMILLNNAIIAVICNIIHYIKYGAAVMASSDFYFEKKMLTELLWRRGTTCCYLSRWRRYHRSINVM